MSKQTAVDLFHDGIIDLLCNASVNSNTVAKLWIECKAMEREQKKQDIHNYFEWHKSKGYVSHQPIDIKQYYEETYGKEAGNANG